MAQMVLFNRRLWLTLLTLGLLAALLGGCTREIVKEVPKEVIVEKEVVKQVPVEVVVERDVIKEIPARWWSSNR